MQIRCRELKFREITKSEITSCLKTRGPALTVDQYFMEKPINTEYELDRRSLSQYES